MRAKITTLFAGFFLLFLILTSIIWLPWFGVIAPFEKTTSILSLSNVEQNKGQIDKTNPLIALSSTSLHNKIVHIKCRFKIHQYKQHMILFQTAPGYTGLSMETGSQGEGAIISRNHKSPTPISLPLVQKITRDTWHTLEITAWERHQIKVLMDGIPDTNSFYHDYLNNEIEFSLSGIKLGTDIAGDQTFDGQITDFSFTVKSIDPLWHKILKKTVTISGIILLVLAIALFARVSQKKISKKMKVEMVSFIVLTGFSVAVAFHYIASNYFGHAYPLDTFLWKINGSQFSDYLVPLLTNHYLDPYNSPILHGEYFPFTYLILYPLKFLDGNLSAFLYSLLFTMTLVVFIKHFISNHPAKPEDRLAEYKNILIVTLMTYPYLFSLERANLENLIFIFMALFVYFYNKKKDGPAILFLAAASAIKLYPLLFVTLYWADRKYVKSINVAALTAILTVVGLLVLKHSFVENYHDLTHALSGMKKNCTALPESCMQFNVGIWGELKLVYGQLFPGHDGLKKLMNIYMASAACLLGVSVFYVCFIESVLWRKLIVLVACILVLPIVSNDYKLIHLFLPIALFMHDRPRSYDMLYAITLSALLIPKNYYLYAHNVSIGCYLNTALLLLMLTFTIIYGSMQKFRSTSP